MRSSRVVRTSDCQCQSRNSPDFHSDILRQSGIWGAADVPLKNQKNPSFSFRVESGAKLGLSTIRKIGIRIRNKLFRINDTGCLRWYFSGAGTRAETSFWRILGTVPARREQVRIPKYFLAISSNVLIFRVLSFIISRSILGSVFLSCFGIYDYGVWVICFCRHLLTLFNGYIFSTLLQATCVEHSYLSYLKQLIKHFMLTFFSPCLIKHLMWTYSASLFLQLLWAFLVIWYCFLRTVFFECHGSPSCL